MSKIENVGHKLGNIASVNFGMQLRNRKEYKEDVLVLEAGQPTPSKFHRECYTGRDIQRYNLKYADRYCFFNSDAKRGGCWDKVVHDSSKKILVRQIGKYPEGAIDDRGYAVLNSAFMIIPKFENISTHFLLGVLNSKVIQFFWMNKFTDDRKTFPKIKGEYLKLLPFPDATDTEQNRISSLVSKISKLNKENNRAFVNELENKINEAIYDIYRLDADDVRAIDEVLSNANH